MMSVLILLSTAVTGRLSGLTFCHDGGGLEWLCLNYSCVLKMGGREALIC